MRDPVGSDIWTPEKVDRSRLFRQNPVLYARKVDRSRLFGSGATSSQRDETRAVILAANSDAAGL